MKTGMKTMRCGGCGNPYHQIYSQDENPNSLFVECTKCHSVTEITFSEPKLQLKWTDDSDGKLAQY